MNTKFKIALIGSGFGGNQMNMRCFEQAKKSEMLPDGVFGCDTNGQTLQSVEERFKALKQEDLSFQPLLLPVPLEQGLTATHGTGFVPEHAEKAFAASREKIKTALAGYHIAICSFAMGKGTGTGTLVPLVELLLEEGILPIVVVCMPAKDSHTFAPQDLDDCTERIKRVMALGIRIFMVDSTVLTTEAFEDRSEDEGYAALDQRTQQIMFDCMGRIFRNPDAVDMTDFCRRFIEADNGGLLIPVYARLSVSAPEEAGAAGKKVTGKEVQSAWDSSLLSFYEHGMRLERALALRFGIWQWGMITGLRQAISSFNPIKVPQLTGQQPQIEASPGLSADDFKVAEGFRIVEATVERDTKELSFAVLLATSAPANYAATPTGTEPKERKSRTWRWQRVGAETSGDAAEPSAKTTEAIAAAATLALPAPVQLSGIATRVNVMEAMEKIFKTKEDASRVTFTNIVVAAEKRGDALAKKLFADPVIMKGLVCGVLEYMNQPSVFEIAFADLQANLADLAILTQNHYVGEPFRQLFLELCLAQEDFRFESPKSITLTDGKTDQLLATDPDEKVIHLERTAKEGLLLKRFRQIRKILGDDFAKLVIPAAESNGLAVVVGKFGSRLSAGWSRLVDLS